MGDRPQIRFRSCCLSASAKKPSASARTTGVRSARSSDWTRASSARACPPLVSEARADVGEIRARHDAVAARDGGHRVAEGVQHRLDLRLARGALAAKQALVHEAREEGHDASLSPARATPEIPEPDRLELDGVLAPVRELGREEIGRRATGYRVQDLSVDLERAERGLEGLGGRREAVAVEARVGRSDDDEAVRVAGLGEGAVRPRVRGAAPIEVDVRRHEATARGRRAADRWAPARPGGSKCPASAAARASGSSS